MTLRVSVFSFFLFFFKILYFLNHIVYKSFYYLLIYSMLLLFFLCQPHVRCKHNYLHIQDKPVTWCVCLYKNSSWSSRIPAQTHESVELLGKEHSSDQCHMMQEVCQHFSSSSPARGRGTYALPASEG